MADRLFAKGEVIDQRFELTEPLGKGAFGAVWKAADQQRDGAPVAIKLLLDRFRQDRKMLARFVQEAKILDKLDHANICRPVAWQADGEDVYLAMEFIDGETLDQKFQKNSVERSPVPPDGIAWICDQLATAIDYAHAEGIVHRDLKPKNVMINRRGQRPFVKILDFGIAKMLIGSEIDPTTVGRVLGSVLYISPEQVLGLELTPRADVFSLGTIMFELITLKRAWAKDDDGRALPFHKVVGGGPTNSHVAVLRRIAKDPRPVASEEREGLSKAVDAVLHRAMAIQPEDRYASAGELALELRAALTSGTPDETEAPTLVGGDDPAEIRDTSEASTVEAPPTEVTRDDRPVSAVEPPPSGGAMKLVAVMVVLAVAVVVMVLFGSG